ncbi:MAG: 50S ribosomal protein L18 [Actinomycetota bacterium]|jgi:large subunit ribosomal protein L18|nr:MAG: 50S ribosomal protein L18 [Actinomycetota bacterium]
MDARAKRQARLRRHARVRKKISGTRERPRLAVFRSNRHIYAQLIDDGAAVTLAQASDLELAGPAGTKVQAAHAVGRLIAERARGAGIERAVFDRGGRLYHGRVAALAEGAREGGLQI